MLSVQRIYSLLLATAACLLLLGTYLFPVHLLPWLTFYNEWLFVLFVGLALAWLIQAKRFLTIGNPMSWLVLITLLVMHALFTQNYTPAQWGLLGLLLLYAGVAWLAYVLGQNMPGQPMWNLLMACIAAAALLSAMLAVLQWLGVVAHQGWDPAFILYSEGGGRVSSNIGQANNLGTLLVIGMGVIGYTWYGVAKRSVTWKALAVLGLLLLVFGVYVSGSRTAVLNLLLWPLLLGAWAMWQRQGFPWLALLPIGGWLMLQWAMPPLIEWWGLFPVQEARSLVQDQSRIRLWSMVLTAIAESPWTGHGIGAVANAHLRFSPEFGAFDYSIAQHAHNTVLDLWAIFGLPLGSLVVGGVVWCWATAWWRSKEAPQQFIWLMATAMLVHAMLEYPLHYGFFLWLLFLLFGVLKAGDVRYQVTIKRPALGSVVWLVLFSTVTVSIWQSYVQVETLYTQYRQRGGEWVQQALAERQTHWVDPLFAEPYERLYWLSTPIEQVVALTPDELKRLERQASLYALPGLGWRVAMAHAAQGRATEAGWWAERMCAMFSPQVCENGRAEAARRGYPIQ